MAQDSDNETYSCWAYKCLKYILWTKEKRWPPRWNHVNPLIRLNNLKNKNAAHEGFSHHMYSKCKYQTIDNVRWSSF